MVVARWPKEFAPLTRTTPAWPTRPLAVHSAFTVVNTLVETRFPMALLWGPELILIYNDAFRVVSADKHPVALGRSTREIWSEIWEINQPIIEAVIERGEALFFEDKLFPINRRGYNEEIYCSPYAIVPFDWKRAASAEPWWSFRERPRFKRAEQSLRESQERLALVTSGTRIGMFDWNIVTDQNISGTNNMPNCWD